MRSAVVRQFGAPLVIEDRPIPEPAPGQVVIRMEAGSIVGTRADLATVFSLHQAGLTRVVSGTRPLAAVNEAIDEVLHGQAKARIVLQP